MTDIVNYLLQSLPIEMRLRAVHALYGLVCVQVEIPAQFTGQDGGGGGREVPNVLGYVTEL